MRRHAALGLAFALAAAGCGNLWPTRPAPFTPRPAAEAASLPAGGLRAYWIGHATVLLQMGDRWVLTDPALGNRIGGVIKRQVAPGIDLAALPVIDAVLISHAHFDHLDVPSLRRLGGAGTLVVPPGVVHFLPRDLPFRAVAPLATWRTIDRDGLRITAVPASHGDSRFGFDALWSQNAHTGYVIEGGGWTVFFAGDTGYDPVAFKEVGRRFRVDLALIPVGPAGRWRIVHRLRRHSHVDPAEALQIFADVGARWMIPIHHGTFFRGGAAERSAIERAIAASRLAPRVLLLQAGESLTLLRAPAPSAGDRTMGRARPAPPRPAPPLAAGLAGAGRL